VKPDLLPQYSSGEMDQMSFTVAIVGCGRMGVATTDATRAGLAKGWLPLSHADAIRAHDGLDIVAVCDLDTAKAQAAGASLGLQPAACFTDVGEMLRTHRPDIVSIATRTPGRVQIIDLALRHGVRAIHSEKPLSLHLNEGNAILQEIERAGVPFSYGTLRRYMPAYRRAKELVDKGAIGVLQEIVIDHGHNDLLLWTHPHSIDLLLLFGGCEIVSVNAICDLSEVTQQGTVIDCDPKLEFARVRFRSGASGLITSSKGMNVRLSGSEGLLNVINNGEALELSSGRKGSTFTERQVLPVSASPSGAQQAFSDLYDALSCGTPVRITPREVATNQRLIWAIVTSAMRDGKSVAWDDVDERLVITGRFGDLTA
jgi:predicted dehydrogenase